MACLHLTDRLLRWTTSIRWIVSYRVFVLEAVVAFFLALMNSIESSKDTILLLSGHLNILFDSVFSLPRLKPLLIGDAHRHTTHLRVFGACYATYKSFGRPKLHPKEKVVQGPRRHVEFVKMYIYKSINVL